MSRCDFAKCFTIDAIDVRDMVLSIQTQVGVKKRLRIKILLLPSELQLDYYLTTY